MPTAEPILPQHGTPSEVIITSVEWLVEPRWRGDRLMARLHEGRVTLTDAGAEPAGPDFAEVARLLESAIDADAAVIDGIWTSQSLDEDGGGARTFVAIDLVELDGQPLGGVPYQERRRLLESVLRESVRVRLTPAVRVPLEAWLDAWRRQGFTHYVAKHVNSRYRPGERVDDWLIVSAGSDRQPSLADRLIRRPAGKPRRIIEDGAGEVHR